MEQTTGHVADRICHRVSDGVPRYSFTMWLWLDFLPVVVAAILGRQSITINDSAIVRLRRQAIDISMPGQEELHSIGFSSAGASFSQ